MKTAPVRLRSFDITTVLPGPLAGGFPVPKPAPQKPVASASVSTAEPKAQVTPNWLARFRAATCPTTPPSRGHGPATTLAKDFLPTPVPQIPAPSRADVQAVARKSAGPRVKFNVERFGIEVSFLSKPAPDVLEALKSARFRWSRFSKCWYKTASQESLQQATAITGQSNDAHLAVSRAIEGELVRRGDKAMEVACGIA